MSTEMTDFAFRTHLGAPFDEALNRTMDALKQEGFGVLTEVDVQSTLREKLDVDFRKYAILGACNPPLAHAALTEKLDIGLLLPCNVIVYEEDEDGSSVAILDPVAMMAIGGDPRLDEVAKEARERLKRVVASLESDPSA